MARFRFEGYVESDTLDENQARELFNVICETTRENHPVCMDIDSWYQVEEYDL